MDNVRSFKRRDVQNCALCGKGLMHDGNFLFWRLRFDRMMMDPQALQRAHGLEQFFGGGQGGAVLSSVMGADEDLAKQITKEVSVLVCEPCVMDKMLGLLIIAEKADD